MRHSLPAVLLLGWSQLAPAQIPTPDTMIVTAARMARTVDATLAPVSVLQRADIERSGARSAADALDGLPGISLARNGGEGKSSSIFLRGTESDHVLVLIDGVRIGSATTGAAALQDIPAALIEHIEVVRGPRSSLYGSEAIGGVIQIFTRRGQASGFSPRLHVGAGNHNSFELGAGASAGFERGWLEVDAESRRTSGENACNGRPSPGGAGCFNRDFDHDGYRRHSASLAGGWRPTADSKLEARWLEVRADNEFDGASLNRSHARQQVLGLSFESSLGENWQTRLHLGRSRDESNNFFAGESRSRFETLRDSAGWLNEFAIGDTQMLGLGADWAQDRVDGSTAYAEDARSDKALFGQYQLELGRQRLDASLRHDDNQQFGHRNTGNLAWAYLFPGQLRLTAAYGTAFKAPTFNELYFPDFGNPTLAPERSRSFELGLASSGAVRWQLNAFQTRVLDLIAYDAARRAPGNIDEARIRGLEASLAARLGAWALAAQASWIDALNRGDGAYRGNRLPRRARETLRLDVGREFGASRVDLTLRAAGQRYDDLANSRRLGGYATVDLNLGHRLDAAWKLQASLTNLLDKDYATAAFYNPPGRGLFVTLSYQP